MKLLVDTNIFLKVLLEQAREDEARNFLSKADVYEFFISDFALHSIGLILCSSVGKLARSASSSLT